MPSTSSSPSSCCCPKLRETKTNYEFLLQVQKTTPAANGSGSDED